MPGTDSRTFSCKRVALLAAMLALLLAAPAAIAGDAADCGAIDQLLKTDPARAVGACHRLAARGDAIAEYNLGLMYYAGQGVAQDYERAVMLFRGAAEQGDPPSQYSLGVAYEFGAGVQRDYVEAAAWYRRAAEQGYIDAQSALGFMYGDGVEIPADYVQAYLWLSLAATAGDTDASEYRDEIAKAMPREQIAQAMRLVSNWQPTWTDEDQTMY
jgi:TPR repeat protein